MYVVYKNIHVSLCGSNSVPRRIKDSLNDGLNESIFQDMRKQCQTQLKRSVYLSSVHKWMTQDSQVLLSSKTLIFFFLFSYRTLFKDTVFSRKSIKRRGMRKTWRNNYACWGGNGGGRVGVGGHSMLWLSQSTARQLEKFQNLLFNNFLIFPVHRNE